MPVEDLIRYFNAADTAGNSTLYIAGGHVEAWHAGLRLSSLFRPIANLRRQNIVGHQASLAARREDGTPLATSAAYAQCESEQAVVHFDRLCRTLHALNFLAQQRQTGGYLQVPVHPRHLLAVSNQHGLVYEAILKRCGLAPADIVLDINPAEIDPGGHFAHALANYRQRGYRLALRAPGNPLALPAVLALAPDILRLPAGDAPLAAGAQVTGILREVDAADDQATLLTALRYGIDLAQGSLFGEPAASCRPTHNPPRNPYNRTSSLGVRHENRQ